MDICREMRQKFDVVDVFIVVVSLKSICFHLLNPIPLNQFHFNYSKGIISDFRKIKFFKNLVLQRL